MKTYKISFPIPDTLTVGDSLLSIFDGNRKTIVQSGIPQTCIKFIAQEPLDGYDNNVITWEIYCTEEHLTMFILKSGAILRK